MSGVRLHVVSSLGRDLSLCRLYSHCSFLLILHLREYTTLYIPVDFSTLRVSSASPTC